MQGMRRTGKDHFGVHSLRRRRSLLSPASRGGVIACRSRKKGERERRSAFAERLFCASCAALQEERCLKCRAGKEREGKGKETLRGGGAFLCGLRFLGGGHACFFFKLFRKMRAKRVCSTPMAAGARSRKFMSPMTVSMKYCARSSSSSPA